MSGFLDLGSEFTTALSFVAGTASDIDLDKAVSGAFHDILLDGTILVRFLRALSLGAERAAAGGGFSSDDLEAASKEVK